MIKKSTELVFHCSCGLENSALSSSSSSLSIELITGSSIQFNCDCGRSTKIELIDTSIIEHREALLSELI